ncbi:MAG: HD-GYP domain-containing protein [Deltaproteobacteria bacterium]|nr:HD-GYP domain-containing protein [Deltaproteobacteria bacterium]
MSISAAWTIKQTENAAPLPPRGEQLAQEEQEVTVETLLSVSPAPPDPSSAVALSFRNLSQQRLGASSATKTSHSRREPGELALSTPETESPETLFLTAQQCLRGSFANIHRGEPFPIGPTAELARRIAVMMLTSALAQSTDRENEEAASYYLLQQAVASPCSVVDVALHSVHVCLFAVKVGIGLGYSLTQLTELALAALLHDVGMLQVPRTILEKPEKLTAEEYGVIKQHPLYGYEILKAVAAPWNWLAQIALQEHEREKGQGYPQGLTGDKIHPYAKVIGLVDVFDALTHPRSYRKILPPFEAVRTIIRMRAEEFSLPIIKAMVEQLSFFPVQSWVQLNSGEIGKVEHINRRSPLRPVVSIVYGPHKAALPSPKVVNLEQDSVLYIVKSLAADEVAEVRDEAVRG